MKVSGGVRRAPQTDSIRLMCSRTIGCNGIRLPFSSGLMIESLRGRPSRAAYPSLSRGPWQVRMPLVSDYVSAEIR